MAAGNIRSRGWTIQRGIEKGKYIEEGAFEANCEARFAEFPVR